MSGKPVGSKLIPGAVFIDFHSFPVIPPVLRGKDEGKKKILFFFRHPLLFFSVLH